MTKPNKVTVQNNLYNKKGDKKMNSDKNTVRLLGAAFLLQAVASAVSGLILLQPLIVPGNIIESMTNIANNALQMRASIVVEMITAIGIVKRTPEIGHFFGDF